VDGAHAPGHISLNLESLGADCYVGNLHKWVSAPRGTGFLWAKPDLHAELVPPVMTFENGSFSERFVWAGTGPLAQALCLPLALREHLEREIHGAHKHSTELMKRFSELVQNGNLNNCAEHWSGRALKMGAFPLNKEVIATPNLELELRALFFNSHKIEVSFTSLPNEPQLYVRPSFQVYNTFDDLEVLFRALKQERLLKFG
jgi:isopenicillin-N epimerase